VLVEPRVAAQAVLEGIVCFELLAGQIRLLTWVAQEECVAIARR
jgi:hypothetical protein